MNNLSKINIDDIQAGYTLGRADSAILREELRELMAYREAAGDPVAYSYKYAGCETCDGFQDWSNEISEDAPPGWMVETGKVTDLNPLYESPQLPVVPDGWALVPIEPTEDMMLHKSECQHHAWDDHDCAMRQTRRLVWANMIAAAPKPGGGNG